MTRSTIQATTAYYDKNPLTQLLRWALATTETLWPRLAIRSATRLFVTPLPHKWSNARRVWDIRGREMCLNRSVFFRGADVKDREREKFGAAVAIKCQRGLIDI